MSLAIDVLTHEPEIKEVPKDLLMVCENAIKNKEECYIKVFTIWRDGYLSSRKDVLEALDKELNKK